MKIKECEMGQFIGESQLLGEPDKHVYPVTKSKYVLEGSETQEQINKRVWDRFDQFIHTKGMLLISDDGYWIVDGQKTGFKVQGEQGEGGKSAYELYIESGGTIETLEEWLESLNGENGEDGITPMLRISTDGISLEISYDQGETWELFDRDFNKLRVIGYVDSVGELPINAYLGDIYGVWNADANEGEGAYELYINTVKRWDKEKDIDRVYEYDSELPASAADGTVVLIPVTNEPEPVDGSENESTTEWQDGEEALDKKRVDGYKVYKYSVAVRSWLMILNTAEIYAAATDIVNHGDNVYALVQGATSADSYQLYKRVVDWQYFGTNASITYHLVQNIEEGTATNVPSGKAVKDAISDELEARKGIVYLNGGEANIISNCKQVAFGYSRYVDSSAVDVPPINFIFFSDLHRSAENLARMKEVVSILKDENSGVNLSDVICAGDNQNRYEESFDWFDDKDILFALGNHEDVVMDSDPSEEDDEYDVYRYHTGRSAAKCFDKYYADRIDGWGVTRPSGKVCYFYKDYDWLRVIFLDCMHDISAAGVQRAWLDGVLQDAIDNGKHVVCVQHLLPDSAEKIDSDFTVIDREYNRMCPVGKTHIFDDAIDAFKAAGGNFVAWLIGHFHNDCIMKTGSNKDQLVVCTSLAANIARTSDAVAVNDAKSQDCFNFISIDKVSKLLRIYRIGRDISRFGQKRDFLSLNYETCTTVDAETIAREKAISAEAAARENADAVINYTIQQIASYIDNGTWIRVITDSDGRVLCGIKKNGEIEWSKGVPTPVKEYVDSQIAVIVGDDDLTARIDSLREIIAFLEDYANSDNLKALLDQKVDIEAGKTLMDSELAESVRYIDNNSWVKLVTDAQGRILWGIKANGDVEHGRGVPTPTKTYIDSIDERITERIDEIVANNIFSEYIDSSEWIYVVTDHDGKILFGIKADGSIEYGKGVPTPVKDYVDAVSENVATEFVTPASFQNYIEATTDNDGRLLSYRTADGTKVEEKLRVNSLALGDNAMQYLIDIVGGQVNNDWSNEEKVVLPMPQEGVKVNIIIPEEYYHTAQYDNEKALPAFAPYVDSDGLIKGGFAYRKELDWQCEIEYFDKLGNYFRKPIELNAQGNSSLSMPRLNQGFDITDGSTVKIGGWVEQDSFHIKKYYIDAFRGQCVVAYRFIEQVYKSRGYGNVRPWDYLNADDRTLESTGSTNKDFDTGALGHPDGFPICLYLNGVFKGVYTWNLKKHRDNYYQKKSNSKHILLDGALGSAEIWNGTVSWSGFEVRNPKSLLSNVASGHGYSEVDIVPATYTDSPDNVKPTDMTEADIIAAFGSLANAPEYLRYITSKGKTKYYQYGTSFVEYEEGAELLDSSVAGYDAGNSAHVQSNTVKGYIERLSGALAAVAANRTRETYESYFNAPFVIDYFIIGNVLYHSDGFRKNWIWGTWDGSKWSPTLYDCDSLFGQHWNGTRILEASLTAVLGNGDVPTYYMCKPTNNNDTTRLYWEDTKARYAQLRDMGIISVNNILGLLEDWLEKVGYENLKADLEDECPETPSYRENKVNSTYWKLVDSAGSSITKYDAAQAYTAGSRVYVDSSSIPYEAITDVPAGNAPVTAEYSVYPKTGGFYNSVRRVKNWLAARIETLDTYYEY